MSHDQDFSVPLGDGSITLEPKDALELRSLRTHPGYSVMRKVLEGINEAAKTSLQDPKQNLDTMRVSQGKIAAVAEVASIVEIYLDEWYESGKSNAEEKA